MSALGPGFSVAQGADTGVVTHMPRTAKDMPLWRQTCVHTLTHTYMHLCMSMLPAGLWAVVPLQPSVALASEEAGERPTAAVVSGKRLKAKGVQAQALRVVQWSPLWNGCNEHRSVRPPSVGIRHPLRHKGHEEKWAWGRSEQALRWLGRVPAGKEGKGVPSEQ